MIRNHATPVTLIVEDGVPVLRSLAITTGQGVSILPEQVGSNALGGQRGLLPRILDGAVVIASVFASLAIYFLD